MSDIRFIDAQGDLLDAAIAEATKNQPQTVLARWRAALRPRTRFAVVAMALIVAGCGVAAATGVFSSSTARLAIGKVDCYDGTGPTNRAVAFPTSSDALMTGVSLLAGETPTTACLQHFKTDYKPVALKQFHLWPVNKLVLIACQKDSITAAVFLASGKANQCQHLGLTPLPHGFAAASSSALALASELRKLYLSRDCWQPQAFARQAKAALNKYGFKDWRINQDGLGKNYTFQNTDRRCAAIDVPPLNTADSGESLDGSTRTLQVGLDIPRSTARLITRADNTIAAKQWSDCYRPSTIRTVVNKAFASGGMTPNIAITTNPESQGFSWGTHAETRHYHSGCLILQSSWPAPDDAVFVWFISRDGTHVRTNAPAPPAADFDIRPSHKATN